MRWSRNVGVLMIAALCALAGALWPAAADAQQASSAHYQVSEVFFGSGGALNDCSPTYCAKESAGETGVGNTKSSSFQAQGGFNTDRTPYLAFSVAGGATDLGVLTTSATAKMTATFSVKDYLSSGYIVQIASPPPSNGTHTFAALSSPTASSAGTEQFGMNLVANTSPATFGANPVQVPSSTYSFGAAAAGYNTANLYKYVNGDTIASSSKSSGETDYTASYIYNISNLTPDGAYTYNGVFVATATY